MGRWIFSVFLSLIAFNLSWASTSAHWMDNDFINQQSIRLLSNMDSEAFRTALREHCINMHAPGSPGGLDSKLGTKKFKEQSVHKPKYQDGGKNNKKKRQRKNKRVVTERTTIQQDNKENFAKIAQRLQCYVDRCAESQSSMMAMLLQSTPDSEVLAA